MINTKDISLKNGVSLRVYNDYIGNLILNTQDYYEKELLDFFGDYIKKHGVIYDIGANIGNHTLYFSKNLSPKKIYSFEPAEKLYGILEFNIKSNKLEHVESFNYAVGETQGKATLNFNEENTGASHLSINNDGDIQVVSLDNMGLLSPDFVKIDVEGFEFYVLKGMENILRSSSPIIWVEIFESNYEKTDEILTELGYVQIDRWLDNYIYIKVTDNSDIRPILDRFRKKALARFNNKINDITLKYRNVTTLYKKNKDLFDELDLAINSKFTDVGLELSSKELNINEKLKVLFGKFEKQNFDLQKAQEHIFLLNNEKDDITLLNKQLTNELQEIKEVNSTVLTEKQDLEEKLQDEILNIISLLNDEETFLYNLEYDHIKEQYRLTDHIKTLETENQYLMKKGKEIEENKTLLSEKIEQIKKQHANEIKKLMETITYINDEKEELNETISYINDEKHKLSEIISSMNDEKHRLTEIISSMKDENHKLNETISSLKDEKQKQSTKINVLDGEVVKLKDEQHKVEGKLSKLTHDYRSLETKTEEALKENKKITVEKGKIYRDFRAQQKENMDLSKKLTSLKEEYDQLNQRYISLKNSTLGKVTTKYWEVKKKFNK